MENLQQNYQEPKKEMSIGRKVFFLGLQVATLMIGALIIWLISYSHENNNGEVAVNIAKGWGNRVTIFGPIISDSDNPRFVVELSKYNCEAEIDTKSLYRSIYEAEVYTAHISMSGEFNKGDVTWYGDSVCIKINMPVSQLVDDYTFTVDGVDKEWILERDCAYVTIDCRDLPEVIKFTSNFSIKGSYGFNLFPAGSKSTLTISGDASNPSFCGFSLPEERNIDGRNFTAKWNIKGGAYSKNLSISDDCIGVRFLVGVDRYQKVSRSLKYAFLIIVLTYISVIFTEIYRKHPISLFNYFLIGAALILFYSLLLGFAEQMAFGASYLIASAMTIGLITIYMWKMLNSNKVGLTIGGILSLMYLSCYILLSLSAFALLLGSILLFAVLALMMYASLKIQKIA